MIQGAEFSQYLLFFQKVLRKFRFVGVLFGVILIQVLHGLFIGVYILYRRSVLECYIGAFYWSIILEYYIIGIIGNIILWYLKGI